MSDDTPKCGRILWQDLTVEDAPAVRDFYRDVVGWEVHPVSMGDYDDYAVGPPGGDPVAGVCHARGDNAGVPAQWLLYVTVEDLEASMARCREGGGEVVREPAPLSGGRFCVVRDPAGAVLALFEEPTDERG